VQISQGVGGANTCSASEDTVHMHHTLHFSVGKGNYSFCNLVNNSTRLSMCHDMRQLRILLGSV